MYHFVNLTPEQQQQRRDLLDRYGLIAQLSVLFPILVVQVFYLTTWLQRKVVPLRSSTDRPGSPYVKSQSTTKPASLLHQWTTFKWWCGEPLTLLGSRLGTKGEISAAVAWTVWLLLLSLLQTGDDYLHVTKRFGIVAGSQLPFHYLLAVRAPYSPLQWLTRSPHERLLSLHQLLGRVVTILLYLHAIFYLNFYILSGLLGAKLKEFYVLCGIAGTLASTVIGTTALSPVRKWSYRVFYAVHVILATALLPTLWFHVSHIRIYLYETALVYALNIAFRFLSSKTYTGTLETVPGTTLLTIQLPAGAKQSFGSWQAGQHAYISLPGHSVTRTFRSNPFTVASLPTPDGKLQFVARIMDGNTVQLAKTAELSGKEQNITVEGPYGLRSHADKLLQYDRVLMIAGGIGATFIVPLYRQLLTDLSPSRGSHRRQKVDFVWVVRQREEIEWAMPEDVTEREGYLERLSVHVTGAVAGSSERAGPETDDADEEEIELQEQKTLLKDQEKDNSHPTADVHIQHGRPDVARLVSQIIGQGSREERVAVLVCGPASLNEAVQREVGKWVYRGSRDIWFHKEAFNT